MHNDIIFHSKLDQQFLKEGKQVVVLDAAVLLEADWQNFCHEVSSPPISILGRISIYITEKINIMKEINITEEIDITEEINAAEEI